MSALESLQIAVRAKISPQDNVQHFELTKLFLDHPEEHYLKDDG
jgi:hypothetical protein